jgi:hypothetical protein
MPEVLSLEHRKPPALCRHAEWEADTEQTMDRTKASAQILQKHLAGVFKRAIAFPVFRRIGILLMALAFFSIAGGQWAVVQSVAWAEMLRDYTLQTGSVTVAVEHTFDGQHACEMCRRIQAAKSQEQEHKQSPVLPGTKEDAKVKAVSADPILRQAQRLATAMVFHSGAVPFIPGWTEAPPNPPPRSGLVAA